MKTIEELKAEKITAMKERDKDKITALSTLINKLFNESVEKKAAGQSLSEADYVRIVQKVINELTEEREAFFKAGRAESVESLDKQIAVVKDYLPKMLTKEEIKDIILSLEDKSVAAVMKHFKTEYAGKVDMRLVGETLKTL